MNPPDMTEGQSRFFELPDQVSWLAPYWDAPQRICHINRIEDAMGVWSQAEQHLAQFFVMVWFGQNRMDFNLVDAVAVLDHPSRMLIVHWVSDPFWP